MVTRASLSIAACIAIVSACATERSGGDHLVALGANAGFTCLGNECTSNADCACQDVKVSCQGGHCAGQIWGSCTACSQYATCDACVEVAGCGWCDGPGGGCLNNPGACDPCFNTWSQDSCGGSCASSTCDESIPPVACGVPNGPPPGFGCSQCGQYPTCESCVPVDGCGWCGATGQCLGDPTSCPSGWSPDTCGAQCYAADCDASIPHVACGAAGAGDGGREE